MLPPSLLVLDALRDDETEMKVERALLERVTKAVLEALGEALTVTAVEAV